MYYVYNFAANEWKKSEMADTRINCIYTYLMKDDMGFVKVPVSDIKKYNMVLSKNSYINGKYAYLHIIDDFSTLMFKKWLRKEKYQIEVENLYACGQENILKSA